MTLEMCVLGSGSGGNSMVVRAGGNAAQTGTILIDAGFGPQATAKKLSALPGSTRVELADISAICLTHLDRDHINMNWLATLVKHQIRVFCHATCVDPLRRAMRLFAAGRRAMVPAAELVTAYETATVFAPVPTLHLQTVRFAHDEAGSHGFLIEARGSETARLAYATDLGHVPEELPELFCGADLLALESNYDPEMELASDRPWPLKQRVMGGRGHLSNHQAYAALQAMLDLTTQRHGPQRLPQHIVLLHRSRECNCPKLMRRLFEQDPRIAPRLTLAEQHEPTGWLRVHAQATGLKELGITSPRITVSPARTTAPKGRHRGQMSLLDLG